MTRQSIIKVFSIGIGLIILAGLVWYVTKPAAPTTDNRPSVVASFYPLAFVTEQIGGDVVRVVNLTPAGVEPHDFEPSPHDIIAIRQASVFLYNGAGLDAWADNVLQNLPANQPRVVRAADNVTVRSSGGAADPHFWLDPQQLSKVVTATLDALQAADPTHATLYATNAAALQQRLQALDTTFHSGLQNCQQRTIVVTHDAFGYLAAAYNVEFLSITGISPENEPSLQRLRELANLVRERSITTIFLETLASPRLAETLARETGVLTAVLNPLEGLTTIEATGASDYFTIMQQNLANLKTALSCP